MKLLYCTFALEFKHAFGVHGHTRLSTNTVFVRAEEEGVFGYGEACLPEYLGESSAETLNFFKACEPFFKEMTSAELSKNGAHVMDTISDHNNAGKAAIDIAINDLRAKLANKTFREFVGITNSSPMQTSITIGIDSEEKIIQKISEAETFKILKVKLGTADDKGLIRLIRKHSDKPIYIDVNQGWTSKEQALEMLFWLSDQQVVLVEQPMPRGMKNEMRWLTKRSPLPTIADESVKRLKDLVALDGEFSGINIKLMKCAGLTEAMAMIEYCRKYQLKVMLGCMAESSCATSAMAQLMSLADFIDLDAPVLYNNDPFYGITYNEGCVQLNSSHGIGVEPIVQLFHNS